MDGQVLNISIFCVVGTQFWPISMFLVSVSMKELCCLTVWQLESIVDDLVPLEISWPFSVQLLGTLGMGSSGIALFSSGMHRIAIRIEAAILWSFFHPLKSTQCQLVNSHFLVKFANSGLVLWLISNVFDGFGNIFPCEPHFHITNFCWWNPNFRWVNASSQVKLLFLDD